MAVANTILYPEEWRVKLQERLDHPTNWKEFCRVDYTDTRVLINPYMSTIPSVQSHTRGTAYTHQTFAITTDSITINSSAILPMFIDRADMAQSPYARQMELAELQGQLINEYIEARMLADHASWTDVGISGGVITSGVATSITVSATLIDDIIRGIKRIIRVANGQNLMTRNGVGIIWRPADFEILEAFVQANGFTTADIALKDGTIPGFRYLGVDHYVSNDHTANHILAGVKKLLHLGIVKSTYGNIVVDEEPATADGPLSGTGISSRLDWAFKTWTNVKPLIFDLNVV